MTAKQKAKHITDDAANILTPEKSSLEAADRTPDGLGEWQGGRIALRASNRWVAEKSHPSRTATNKTAPGTEYVSKITHRQDQDFNEIHTDANGDFFLYNHKTDAWDIKGDSADIPYYEDERGWRWGYNIRTGVWDVPVEEQEYV